MFNFIFKNPSNGFLIWLWHFTFQVAIYESSSCWGYPSALAFVSVLKFFFINSLSCINGFWLFVLFVVFISILPARSPAFYPKQSNMFWKSFWGAVLGWRWEREFWQDHHWLVGKKIRNIWNQVHVSSHIYTCIYVHSHGRPSQPLRALNNYLNASLVSLVLRMGRGERERVQICKYF